MKKNYSINNNTMTITADLAQLNEYDLAKVRAFFSLGYKFKQKSHRDGSNRKRSFFASELYKEDFELFNLLENQKCYGTAVSFGNKIIKLGKAFDKGLVSEDDINEYRVKVQDDFKKAQIFADNLLKVA